MFECHRGIHNELEWNSIQSSRVRPIRPAQGSKVSVRYIPRLSNLEVGLQHITLSKWSDTRGFHQRVLKRHQQVHKHNEAGWDHFRRTTTGFENLVPVDFTINCLHIVLWWVVANEFMTFLATYRNHDIVQAAEDEIDWYKVPEAECRPPKVVPTCFIVFVNLLISGQTFLMMVRARVWHEISKFPNTMKLVGTTFGGRHSVSGTWYQSVSPLAACGWFMVSCREWIHDVLDRTVREIIAVHKRCRFRWCCSRTDENRTIRNTCHDGNRFRSSLLDFRAGQSWIPRLVLRSLVYRILERTH